LRDGDIGGSHDDDDDDDDDDYPKNGGSRFLQDLGTFIPNSTTSHP